MARQLKVFRAHLGFFDTIVAAPSRKAALEAWGVRQDLFAEGEAAVSDDKAEIAAATANPGVVLRRTAGSKGEYRADADVEAVRLPPAPRRAEPRTKAGRTKAAPNPEPKPPDRSRVIAAEAALRDLEAERKRALERLEQRRAALAEEIQAARSDLDERLKAAKAELAAARQDLRRRA